MNDYTGSHEPQAVLRWALETFGSEVAYFCSFQETVLIHMMTQIRPDVRVVAIDTGRLPEETYQCALESQRRFKIQVEWFFPRHQAVEELLRQHGVYSFRDSVEARKACCAVRKLEPQRRALQGLQAWITGARRDQSETRGKVEVIARDHAHGGILKISPLADWTREEVWAYTRQHHLPYNRLFDRGYGSVGCECCTRALKIGEQSRAGRWWWETSERKECGLHVEDWTI